MANDNDNNNNDNGWAVEFNGHEDDDEALRVAIALSLGQDPGAGSPRTGGEGVVDLTRDGDEDEGGDAVVVDGGKAEGESRRRAANLGGQGSEDGAGKPQGPILPESAREQSALAPTPTSTAVSNPLGLAGLDRKKMEEERLARLGKRKAVQLDDDLTGSRPVQRPRVGPAIEKSSPPPPISATSSREVGPSANPRAMVNSASYSSAPATARPLPFPRGVVKKTWAYGQPRQGDDIKIEEVLQKQQLEMAVLSSFQWDEEWLLSKVDLARTKLILVAFAASEAQREEMCNNVPRDRVRFCFPPMQTMGSMHSKLMLLKYEKYMRIVVPTGNLMSYDWGETGTMENMVFIIDLPKFQVAEEREAQQLTPFGEELLYFLRAQGLDDKLVSSLLNYDFAETVRYHFVHTIPGSHTAEDAWTRTGYCGFGRVVKALGLASPSPIDVDYVCASIGAVNDSLLSSLYYACQGDSGLREYNQRTAGGNTASPADKNAGSVRERVRVYFPARDTVLQSKGGKDGAGTICFQARWWQAPTFPREVLRDCVSRRKGLLMHSKVIYVRPRGGAGSSGTSAAGCFAYVGSANLSESAWGRLVRDRATGKPKLTCRNWECGVLIRCGDAASQQSGGPSFEHMEAFEGHVPVPMKSPSRSLSRDPGPGAVITPWFYNDG